MLIQTKHFGETEIDETKIIKFEEGIFGFEDQRKFVILYEGEAGENPFCWLQSLDQSQVCLPMIDPLVWFPEYQPELDDDEILKLGELDPNAISIYTVVVVPENLEEMTTNLRAPIIVNIDTKKGAQLITVEDHYQIRENLYKRIKSIGEE